MLKLVRFVAITVACSLAGMHCVLASPDDARAAKNVDSQIVACPSMNFRTFFEAFRSSQLVQRQFTQLPLIYGKREMLTPGDPFWRRKIRRFESIPDFNPDDGRIFPSKESMVKDQLSVTFQEGRDERDAGPWVEDKAGLGAHADGVIAVLSVQDSGYQIYYRFRKRAACWILVGIDDKST
jgi:hypothetical protein